MSRRTMVYRAVILAAAFLGALCAQDDLKNVSAEPNPVKRARLALGNGERVALKAGEACKANDPDNCNKLLEEVKDSVELASKSLEDSSIDSRRNSRHFKDAEIRTHKILRLVEPLRTYMNAEDVDHFDSIYHRISEINDRFLFAVFGKKKK